MAKDAWRDWLRALLFDNFGLKLISLICALSIYAFIHGADNAQRTFAVSVVTVMPPDSANRQLMTPIPNEVAVTLRGSRTQMQDLRPDELGSLQLDLRSGRESEVDLTPEMFHIPPGLHVQHIEPATIELRWDDVVMRQIPVQVARIGELVPGYTVKGATLVEPPFITARGPKSIVDVIQFARAAPFDVTGLSDGTLQRPLALDKPPKLVTYDRDSILATIEITRERVPKQFTNLKVEVVGIPRATTTPPTVTVVVTGTSEEVNALLPEAIIPRVEPRASEIDLNQSGNAYLDVLVDVPLLKVEVRPAKVLVKWDKPPKPPR